MRGAERPPPHEPELPRRFARDRPDFGGDRRFFPGHRRQNARHRLCHGTFPRTRTADENQVVPPGRSDFHAPLGPFLAQDVGKVHVLRPLGALPFQPQGLPVAGGVPDQEVRRIILLSQDTKHVVESLHSIYQRLVKVHCFQGRPFRQDDPLVAGTDGKFHHRQGSGYVTDASVQTQFAHNEVFLQPRQFFLPRGGNDSQGDGQVIPAALLVQIRRCQVDDNLLPRDSESLRLQGRHRPQQALFHGRIGQSHQMDSDSERDIHLHRDRNRLDSDTLRSMYIDQHTHFCPKMRNSLRTGDRKRKNVAEFFLVVSKKSAKKGPPVSWRAESESDAGIIPPSG